jgi:hypothetical protein
MEGLSLTPPATPAVAPDAAGKAGAALAAAPVDTGATFTAAEQVAAGIMMGGANSSAPANAAEAAAAVAQDMQVD